MAEEERRQKNTELMTKKREYTGYDDDEFTGGSEGMKRSVLAKYDEDLEGAKETASVTLLSLSALTQPYIQGFRLGGAAAATSTIKSSRKEREEIAASVNKSLLSIDYASESFIRYLHADMI